jgi:hypothetical protein
MLLGYTVRSMSRYSTRAYPLYAVIQVNERTYAIVGRSKWATRVRYCLPKSWHESKEEAIAAARAMARPTDRIVLLGPQQQEEAAQVIQGGS